MADRYAQFIKNLYVFGLECNFCHWKGSCIRHGFYDRSYLLSPGDFTAALKRILAASTGGEEKGAPQEVDTDLAVRILEMKKQKRSIDKTVAKLEKELGMLFDGAGISCLEIEMGLLVRRKAGDADEWVIEI